MRGGNNNYTWAVAVLTLIGFASLPAHGDPAIVQLAKLTEVEPQPGNVFGGIQAIDGEHVFLGAPRRVHDGVEGAGGVDVYRLIDGEPVLVQVIVPPSPTEDFFFGRSLSVHGNTLLVGEWLDFHVYRLIEGAWAWEHKIEWQLNLPPIAFRATVHGDRIVVASSFGFVFDFGTNLITYRYVGGAWQIEQLIEFFEPYEGDAFGFAVRMNDRFIAVGAPQYLNDAGDISGAIEIYELLDSELGESWAYRERLAPADALDRDQFGLDFDLDDDRLIAGSWRTNGAVRNDGAAYVYVFDGEGWVLEQKLFNPDGVRGAQFGYSVAIDGDYAVAGSPTGRGPDGIEYGTALLFERDESGWTPAGPVLGRNLSPIDRFGNNMELDGSNVLISAIGDNTHGLDSGAAYLFTICGADLNGDGVIDTADLGKMLSAYGQKNDRMDFSGDGLVDPADLALLISEFGTHCP